MPAPNSNRPSGRAPTVFVSIRARARRRSPGSFFLRTTDDLDVVEPDSVSIAHGWRGLEADSGISGNVGTDIMAGGLVAAVSGSTSSLP